MCRSAQKAGIRRAIGAFEDNGPKWCEDFENKVLVIVFEVHNITDADSGGSSVTKRYFAERRLNEEKRDANGLTIRKLLSLQKGVR